MSITHLTADSFGDFTSCPNSVLVDFCTDTCRPVLAEVSAARPAVPVGMVNVDEEPDLARAYVVRSIPTLLLWKNGELTDRWTGEVPAGVILDAVDAEAACQPEHDALSPSPLHDYAAHTMPRMYAAPLPGMPYDGVPGQFYGLQDTWQTW